MTVSRIIQKGLRAALMVVLLVVWIGCDGDNRSSVEPNLYDTDFSLSTPTTVRVLLFSSSRVQVESPEGACSIWDGTGENELVLVKEGDVFIVSRSGDQWQADTAEGKSLLGGRQISGKTLEIRTKEGGPLAVGESQRHRYRGKLRLTAGPDHTIAVINVVDLEGYLKGVVGCEAYSNWYLAALRAQSIACRTYALWSVSRRAGRGDWDMSNDQGSQVYGGMEREHARVTRAVNETLGMVLIWGEAGNEKLFPTYYSSTCGGATESASAVFGDEDRGCLRGVVCPYCAGAAPAHLFRWTNYRVSKAAMSDRLRSRMKVLEGLGPITGLEVTARSASGRVLQVKVTDASGATRLVDGALFRLAVTTAQEPLRSNWYTLLDEGSNWLFSNGKGFGHGVGMCQWGCQGMALKGKDCISILSHYYPGAKLVRYIKD